MGLLREYAENKPFKGGKGTEYKGGKGGIKGVNGTIKGVRRKQTFQGRIRD